jgi:hypothetical protein
MDAGGWPVHDTDRGIAHVRAFLDQNIRPGPAVTPGEFADELPGRMHGPHDDATTIGSARLAGELIRFLNYATRPHAGGLTEPASVYLLAGELAAVFSRLPQLFSQLGDWLTVEESSGRLRDDGGRPAGRLAGDACTALDQATTRARALARDLMAVQMLTAGLCRPGENAGGNADA